jgi:hypothetical protein
MGKEVTGRAPQGAPLVDTQQNLGAQQVYQG